MKNIPESFPRSEKPETIIETRESFLRRLTTRADKEIREALTTIGNGDAFRQLERVVAEFGVTSENVHTAVAEASGIGGRATMTFGEKRESASPKIKEQERTESSSYNIALLGVMLSGCGASGPESTLQSLKDKGSQLLYQDSGAVIASGDRMMPEDLLRIASHAKSPELESVIGEECGPAKPGNAPKECGHQQWAGFSETNPVAVAWMAVANTGTEACRVSITRLELSYLSQDANEAAPSRKMLSSDINGVQLLADGTDGGWWGKYIHNLPTGSTFDLQPNIHAYVHPFGPMMAVPEDATEVTVTFATEITGDCIASGGMDTYEENAIPNTEPPYTQDGSETDFIKEAMKTPWITQTVNPDVPISYSINRLPRNQRTGWAKDPELYKGK